MRSQGVSMERRQIDPETRMAAVGEGLSGENWTGFEQVNQGENLRNAAEGSSLSVKISNRSISFNREDANLAPAWR
jgi:hypothetical protein